MFNLHLLPGFNLEQVTNPDGRYYLTEDGLKLQSVTTVLGKIPDKVAGLAEWREKVGDEEADMVQNMASYRGTIIHDRLEQYVRGVENYNKNIMPIYREIVDQLAAQLDQHVTDIYVIEQRLYSEKLMLAGTADLFCLWDGVETVVDYKTSRKNKKAKNITDYFLQSTAYAMMLKERYGVAVNQICILIYVDDEGVFPFIKKIDEEYKEKATKIFSLLSKK
jgi:genome maintenance exonuclease 1